MQETFWRENIRALASVDSLKALRRIDRKADTACLNDPPCGRVGVEMRCNLRTRSRGNHKSPRVAVIDDQLAPVVVAGVLGFEIGQTGEWPHRWLVGCRSDWFGKVKNTLRLGRRRRREEHHET